MQSLMLQIQTFLCLLYLLHLKYFLLKMASQMVIKKRLLFEMSRIESRKLAVVTEVFRVFPHSFHEK